MQGASHRAIRSALLQVLSLQTIRALRNDAQRLRARIRVQRRTAVGPLPDLLHLGCGSRHLPGWLNVDLAGSDWNIDLARGRLPWPDGTFSAVVSQHLVEHLMLEEELIPMLSETHRVIKDGGELWVSCPDIGKICRSYIDHEMEDLIADARNRWPDTMRDGKPSSHFINDLFHQSGNHQNLFDFALLSWTLEKAGFANIREVSEEELLSRFPAFPARNDGALTLYVYATT